jgi:hypothetical protein
VDVQGLTEMKKNKHAGSGLYQNDVTEGLNRAFGNKIRKNIKASDAWRKAKEEDPKLEFRMSFVDFKRIYFRPKKKNSKSTEPAPENKKWEKRV